MLNKRNGTNKTECRVEKVIRKNGAKLCVKPKRYDNSFTNWAKYHYATSVNIFLNHMKCTI